MRNRDWSGWLNLIRSLRCPVMEVQNRRHGRDHRDLRGALCYLRKNLSAQIPGRGQGCEERDNGYRTLPVVAGTILFPVPSVNVETRRASGDVVNHVVNFRKGQATPSDSVENPRLRATDPLRIRKTGHQCVCCDRDQILFIPPHKCRPAALFCHQPPPSAARRRSSVSSNSSYAL